MASIVLGSADQAAQDFFSGLEPFSLAYDMDLVTGSGRTIEISETRLALEITGIPDQKGIAEFRNEYSLHPEH